MIHPDGIEVYLKPAGKDNESVKYAEFPVPNDGPAAAVSDDHEMHSIILARDEDFVVVVRCQSSFKMYGASALLVATHDGMEPPHGGRMAPTRVIQRSFAHEQIIKEDIGYYKRQGRTRSYRYSKLHMRDASEAMRGNFDNGAAVKPIHGGRRAPGSILVSVYRGTAQWDDSSEKPSRSPYGAGNPAKTRTYQRGTPKRLASPNGRNYTFEFKYRSEACIRQLVSPEASGEGAQVDTEAMAIVDDSDFLRNRKLDEVEREKMSAAWLKREAELAQNSNSNPRSSDDPPEGNTEQAANVGNSQTLPSRRKQPPGFCDCPVQHRNQPRRPSAPEGRKTSGRRKTASSAQRTGLTSSHSEDDSSSPAVSPEELEGTSNETPSLSTAAVCSKCRGIKIAQNRRPAFLRQWYDSHEGSSVPAADEDDDEPLPEAKVESTADTARGGEQELTRAAPPSSADGTLSESSLPSQATPAEGTGSADEATPNSPAEVAGVAEETACVSTRETGLDGLRKRAATIDLESTKTKQPRVDVDLTGDDDNDVVEIKTEQAASAVTRSHSNGGTGQDEEELQEQLREIELGQKEIQLQREKMRVEAKLKALQRKRAAQVPVKVEGVIKVED